MKNSISLFSLLSLLLLSSCKINQKVQGERIGRWVFRSTVEGKKEVHRGRYGKDGFQKGVWTYRQNGKLYKREVIKDSLAQITYYHPNRKVASFGETFFVTTPKGLHYYYTGSWFVYDVKGKLIEVKHYYKGVLIHITTL